MIRPLGYDPRAMADLDITAPDDLRRDVRSALKSSWMDSLKQACKFSAGLVAICAVVGVELVALQKFNVVWMVSFGVVAIAGGAFAYGITELTRLHEQSDLLRRLLDSEKYYESLLRTAREDKQLADDAVHILQTRLDIVMGVRELLGRQSDLRAAKALPPEPENENG
jgi:hypothetical protein